MSVNTANWEQIETPYSSLQVYRAPLLNTTATGELVVELQYRPASDEATVLILRGRCRDALERHITSNSVRICYFSIDRSEYTSIGELKAAAWNIAAKFLTALFLKIGDRVADIS
ncbi:hypothetical protein [uncultured Duncaniella sp.]|uniref:hypothetical protein n=1 Tax=uncultured Duncaniella sp. TaxID=2768039 RepID=UPI0025A931EF|nr:hypothetical protein [uncultured Duncaniella sp.]